MPVLHVGALPLVGGEMGVQVLQLLGGDEAHLPLQLHLQLREGPAQGVAGVAHRPHNGADGVAEVVLVPLVPGDDLLPVPLIHVDGVDVVQAFVPADGVHVGIEPVAGVEAVALEGQALPLGQGVDHLPLRARDGGDVEAHRPLHAVEVVIQSRVLIHKQRRGHTAQIQRELQVLLKAAFDELNGPLHVVAVERRPVAAGDDAGIHRNALLCRQNISADPSYTIRRENARKTSASFRPPQL